MWFVKRRLQFGRSVCARIAQKFLLNANQTDGAKGADKAKGARGERGAARRRGGKMRGGLN